MSNSECRMVGHDGDLARIPSDVLLNAYSNALIHTGEVNATTGFKLGDSTGWNLNLMTNELLRRLGMPEDRMPMKESMSAYEGLPEIEVVARSLFSHREELRKRLLQTLPNRAYHPSDFEAMKPLFMAEASVVVSALQKFNAAKKSRGGAEE